MFCPNCGTQISETALFCYNCGNAIEVEKNNSEMNQIPSNQNIQRDADEKVKLLLWIGIGIFVSLIVLIFVLIILFKENTKSSISNQNEVITEKEDNEINTEELVDFPTPNAQYQIVEMDGFRFEIPSDYTLKYINGEAEASDLVFDCIDWTKNENSDSERKCCSGCLGVYRFDDDNPNYNPLYKSKETILEQYGGWNTEKSIVNGLEMYHLYVDANDMATVFPAEMYMLFKDDIMLHITCGYNSENIALLQNEIKKIADSVEYVGEPNFDLDKIQYVYSSDENYVNEVIDNESEEKDSQQISSLDFKEFMDSYEAFMDSYITFMKKYENSPDASSMLNEYMDILDQYNDYVQKLDEIDENSLSKEDYDYYIEVITRVERKLLDVVY